MANKKENVIREIELPSGVSALVTGSELIVKGKNEVKRKFKTRVSSIKVNGPKIIIQSKRDTKEDRKEVGSINAHIKNMVRGSMEGHHYTLKICSGHFPMNVSVSANKLIVKNFLGEKVPRVLELKEGATVKVEGDLIKVTSPNKEIAGQVSADIEQLTRRPGFDSRVFQDGIYIINKDGEDLK